MTNYFNPSNFHPAMYWRCPKCGGDNFIRSEPAMDLSEEELEELREISEEDEIEYQMYEIPTHIHCEHCWEKFQVPKLSEED